MYIKYNYSGIVAKYNFEVLILSIFPLKKEILCFFTVQLSDCS